MNGSREPISRTIRKAARAVGRAGLAHAYGHCSARLDAVSVLVCPPRPMGLIRPGEACDPVAMTGPLPEGVLGEVRIHREIYRRRPDVGGIVRAMPAHTMTLGTLRETARPRHGFGAYFAPQPALWDDPQLVRTDAQAEQLADTLGTGRAIVMRGNGAVTVGKTLEEAVVLMWYLEDASRIELACRGVGPHDAGALLSLEEARTRATWDGRIMERMWDYLTSGDPEPD